MDGQKYSGIYYPNSWIEDKRSLATFSLFFDEIHLITQSDFAKDPTTYLKELPDKFYIHALGNPAEELIRKVGAFYQFAVDNQALLGEIIFYHPHLLDLQINEITDRLLHGGVPVDDLLKFIVRDTPELQALDKFYEQHPEVKDEIVLKVAPTALFLSKKHDWVLIGDNPEMPIPIFSEKLNTVRELTSILAEECIRIVLPQCEGLNAEDILSARDKLKDLLVPFRMTMQKMSGTLRCGIKNKINIEEVKAEAQFMAQSSIEPALFEMRQKIEKEKNKLWLRISGSVASWIPFVAKAFLAPTPDQIYNTMVKVYGDVGKIADAVNEVSISREPGLSFLLGVEKTLATEAKP
jgi:hypothetical protein